MASWTTELPAKAVEGALTHIEDHDKIVAAITEARTEVDRIDSAVDSIEIPSTSGLASEVYVDNAIAGIVIPPPPDLSGYATKAELAGAHDSIETLALRALTPEDFGAVGDGVADDTAAWNDALSQAPPGATITAAPGGRYKLSGPLDVSKPVTIVGGELLPHSEGKCLNITASDVTIRGSRFTSPSAADPLVSHQIIAAVGTSSAPLRRVTVDKVVIDKSRYHGVWLEWCEDVKVRDCQITDFQYGAVMLISVTRGEVSGCIIRNALQEGTLVNSYGVAATDLVNTTEGRSRDILITRNIVDNVSKWEGIDTHGGERITITDNIITRCRYGVAAVAGNSSRATVPKDVVVSGNTIDSLGIESPTSAIKLYGITGGPQASAMIGPNVIRGGYVMDVEAKNFEEAGTTIQAQASTVPNKYANHPAPFRQWNAVTHISRNGSSTTRTVNFPEGTFTKPPMVFLTEQPGRVATVQGWSWMVQSVTTTSVVIYGEGPVGLVDVQMGILAVQMGSLTAPGLPRS